MSILVKALPAPRPRTENAKKISLFYAAILVVFAVAQLFTFDEFVRFFSSLNMPISNAWAYALAPIVIVAEVFALPFLLRMKLSIAFRWFSMMLGWLVAGIWFFVSLWVVTMQPEAQTVGFLGTAVNLVPGWWAVFASLALGILATWASWGLWPGRPARVSKKK
jgi:hypothetical protein